MSIEIHEVELINKSEFCSLYLSNPSQETMLVLSKNNISEEIYLEWNDASSAAYNAIILAKLEGNIFTIQIDDKFIDIFGTTSIEAYLKFSEIVYSDFQSWIKSILGDKLSISKVPFVSEKVTDNLHFENIKYLNLSGKNLKLPPPTLEKHADLEELFILDNPDLDIESTFQILKGLPKLKKLHISIYGMIPQSVSSLTSLQSLHIEGSPQCESLPHDIGRLNKLTYIYLQSTKDIVLPPQFSNLAALEFLHVRAESWFLSEDFYKLSRLKLLDLYNCKISDFPIQMAHMENLETIYLGFDDTRDYEKVFEIFCNIRSLKTLEISVLEFPEIKSSHCSLEDLTVFSDAQMDDPFNIPASIIKLQNLKSLTFNECNILEIPIRIFELSNLEELNFTECKIENIPAEIINLNKLKSLCITECPGFKSLPKELEEMKSLTELQLEDFEKIGNVPLYWIEKLRN